MKNLRMLAGLLAAVLSGGGTCVCARTTLTLEEIFECAESHSRQLRPSVSAESEALKDISIARAERLPEINATLSLSYIGDGFTTQRNFSDYEKAPIPHFGNTLNISVSQPLYTGGAVKAGIELAELKSMASRFATELKRDNLRMQLTGFYLDIYKCYNIRSVLENNIIRARKVLDEMKARYDQGVALKNDITRYELLLSNFELELIRINNTLNILNRNLAVTAGLPEDTEILPDSTLLSRALPLKSEDLWQTEAGQYSPIIRLAGAGVDMSRRGEALARSERMPKIGLQAGWNMDGPILVEVPPINRNLSYWYVGVGVSYNLSSLYKTNKKLSKSRVATIKAEEELEATRENVSLEVRAGYIRYLEAYEELRTREKSVELADLNYLTTSTRYSADMALITDMLDAANACLDAEQQLVNARINIIYYYYKLLFTSGKI